MSDSKTYVFGSEGGMQGLDPNILLANGGGFGNGMWNNPIWAKDATAATEWAASDRRPTV